jgi:hypothetical protein
MRHVLCCWTDTRGAYTKDRWGRVGSALELSLVVVGVVVRFAAVMKVPPGPTVSLMRYVFDGDRHQHDTGASCGSGGGILGWHCHAVQAGRVDRTNGTQVDYGEVRAVSRRGEPWLG